MVIWMDVGDIDGHNKNNNSHTIANKKDIAGQSGDQHNDFAVFAAMQHWRAVVKLACLIDIWLGPHFAVRYLN